MGTRATVARETEMKMEIAMRGFAMHGPAVLEQWCGAETTRQRPLQSWRRRSCPA
jgi:hypothetical protein